MHTHRHTCVFSEEDMLEVNMSTVHPSNGKNRDVYIHVKNYVFEIGTDI